VTSANIITSPILLIFTGQSLMYILKRSESRTEIRGTPMLEYFQIWAKIMCIRRFQYYCLLPIYEVKFKTVQDFSPGTIIFQFEQQKLIILIVKHPCQVTQDTRYIHFLIPCIEDRISQRTGSIIHWYSMLKPILLRNQYLVSLETLIHPLKYKYFK
jgi:hypothetical protein